MSFDDIVKHFGSIEKAKAALGLRSRQTLYNWKEDGVPDGEQCRIHLLTKGKLPADKAAISGRAQSAAQRRA